MLISLFITGEFVGFLFVVFFPHLFILKYFKPLEKLQEKYNENPCILHLDSPTVNNFLHLLYVCVDIYIHLAMCLSLFVCV